MDVRLKKALELMKVTAKRDDCTGFDGRTSWFNPQGNFIGRYTDPEGLEVIQNAMDALVAGEAQR
jgi:hypothetical protein